MMRVWSYHDRHAAQCVCNSRLRPLCPVVTDYSHFSDCLISSTSTNCTIASSSKSLHRENHGAHIRCIHRVVALVVTLRGRWSIMKLIDRVGARLRGVLDSTTRQRT